MQFDTSISLPQVFNALLAIGGLIAAFVRIGGRIDLLAQRVLALEERLKADSGQEKRITIVEERLSALVQMLTVMQRDISDLRRGDGFIRGSRGGVDGEYK